MTAEERMAYFQGTKRRSDVYHEKTKFSNRELIFFRIRFFLAVMIFILFLSMDYTGYKFRGIGSEEIIEKITCNFDFEQFKNVDFDL